MSYADSMLSGVRFQSNLLKCRLIDTLYQVNIRDKINQRKVSTDR